MPPSKPIFPALTRASEVKPQTTQTHFRHTLQFFLLSSTFSLNPQPFPYPHLFPLPSPFSLTLTFFPYPHLFPLPSPFSLTPSFPPTRAFFPHPRPHPRPHPSTSPLDLTPRPHPPIFPHERCPKKSRKWLQSRGPHRNPNRDPKGPAIFHASYIKKSR